jgi:integrase
MRRKPSTVQDYRCILDAHLVPFFGEKAVDRIKTDDFAAYVRAKTNLAPKTINNHLNFAHGLFKHAAKREWVPANVVAAVDRPRLDGADPDIRFLDLSELEALLRAVPTDDVLAPVDRTLYLTAAMTGLRQGELIALRWRDVDWPACLIRVRQNITRGRHGTPKSRRGSRAVPMADRVAAALDRHFERSAYQQDDDLVFCHPHTGNPYDPSKIRERFYQAMKVAGMGNRCKRTGGITFHSLRHTFGTRMAAVGTPLRTLQEWMGHADYKTTLIYADYAPDPAQGVKFAEAAFCVEIRLEQSGNNAGNDLQETETNSDPLKPSRFGG